MHIHLIASLIAFHCLVSCRQDMGLTPTMAANATCQSIAVEQPFPETTLPQSTNMVLQSVDGGQSWQDVSTGLPREVQPILVFVNDGEVFLGTQNGLYSSPITCAAPNWQQVPFLNGRILGVSPGRYGLYVCSYGLGIFQNLGGTGVWKNINKTMKDNTVRCVLETPDGAILAGSDSGIFKSADGGQTWKQVFAEGMVLNLVESGGVLIGGGARGVLRSTDGGAHWDVVLNENILAKNTTHIKDQFVTILGTTDPNKDRFGSMDSTKGRPQGITNRLRASADGGQTWQRMDQALLPLPGVYGMDESLSQAKDIYDIVQAGELLFCTFDTGVFRSSDQGKSWTRVLPNTGNKMLHLAASGQTIFLVLFDGC